MADGLEVAADFFDFFDLAFFDLAFFDLDAFNWAVVSFLVDFEIGLTMGRVLDRGDEREIFLYAPLRYPKP